MLRYAVLSCTLFWLAFAEPPVSGVKPTNVLGSSDQHASFSFVRPGLTQTAFAFSGPSSHQSFSSSIGNPQLVQKVLPGVAQALAYRNPGLGTFPLGPVANGYANVPQSFAQAPLPYQTHVDPANALAYYQQLQQLQQYQQPQLQQYQQPQLQQYQHPYQAQIAQLLALRQAQLQAQAQPHAHVQPQQVPEQIQLQQEQQQQQQAATEQSQNLLGVAYSAAPSVAHVKVSGNGYKFDF